MKKFLLSLLFLFILSPAFCATLVNNGNINWSGNWQTVSKNDTLHASTIIYPDSLQTVYSQAWDGNAANTDLGVMAFISGFDTNATGTLTATLQEDPNDDGNWADVADRASTTMTFTQTITKYPSYVFFKYSSTHTETAGTANYRVAFANSGNTSNEIGLRVVASATTYPAIIQVLNATAAVASTDITYTCGVAQASTNNPSAATVTVDVNLNGTAYGAVYIENGGVLAWSTAAATTTYLEIAGNIDIQPGGELDMGTVATPIPAGSSATLEGNIDSADRYLYVRANTYTGVSGGKLSIQGVPFTGNVWRTTTTTAITSGNTNPVTLANNVQTAGWLAADSFIVSTTSGVGETEEKIIAGGGVSGTQITPSANWTNNHATVAEVCNISRTANITASGTVANQFQWLIYEIITTSVDIDYARFKDVSTTSGMTYNAAINAYWDVDYCVFQNITSGACIYLIYSEDEEFNFSNNMFYNNAAYSYFFALTARAATQYPAEKITIDSCSFVKQKNSSVGHIYLSAPLIDITNSNFYDYTAGTSYNRGIQILNGTAEVTNCKFWGLEEAIAATNPGRLMLKNCVLGGDGTNTVANSRADIYCYHVPQILAYNTKFLSATEVTVNSGQYDDFWETRITSHDHDATQYRYKLWETYGTMTDNTTTAMTAQGGSGACLVMSPTSTTAGNILEWQFYIPVTAAIDPQLKFYVQTTTAEPEPNPTLNIDVYDSDDDTTLLENNTSIALTESWAQYTVSLDANPTDTGYCRVVLKTLDGANTGDIGIDTLSYVLDGTTYTVDFERWKDGVPDMAGEGAATGGGGGGAALWINN